MCVIISSFHSLLTFIFHHPLWQKMTCYFDSHRLSWWIENVHFGIFVWVCVCVCVCAFTSLIITFTHETNMWDCKWCITTNTQTHTHTLFFVWKGGVGERKKREKEIDYSHVQVTIFDDFALKFSNSFHHLHLLVSVMMEGERERDDDDDTRKNGSTKWHSVLWPHSFIISMSIEFNWINAFS